MRLLIQCTVAVLLAALLACRTGWSEPGNEIYFENQSGADAVVRIFDAGTEQRVAEITVPNAAVRGGLIASGSYYIVVRYGPYSHLPEEQPYTHSRGESFEIRAPAGFASRTKITLHAVVHGNYASQPVQASVFER